MRFVRLEEIALPHQGPIRAALLLDCMVYPAQMETFAKAGLYRILGEIVSGVRPQDAGRQNAAGNFRLVRPSVERDPFIDPTWRGIGNLPANCLASAGGSANVSIASMSGLKDTHASLLWQNIYH